MLLWIQEDNRTEPCLIEDTILQNTNITKLNPYSEKISLDRKEAEAQLYPHLCKLAWWGNEDKRSLSLCRFAWLGDPCVDADSHGTGKKGRLLLEAESQQPYPKPNTYHTNPKPKIQEDAQEDPHTNTHRQTQEPNTSPTQKRQDEEQRE